jgi:hypothetical protein
MRSAEPGILPVRRLAILLLTLVVLPQAFALDAQNCEARLAGLPVPAEVREVYTGMQKLGLNSLLSDVYSHEVAVVVKSRWLPFQPGVSARVSGWGRKSLVIRDSDVSTPFKKQKFTWDVALALYELQMQPWIWSKKSMVSPDAVEALAVGEDEDALAYFALQMPKEWRDQYLDKANSMLRELYALFLTLPLLRAEDLMAAEDPGRTWIMHAMFMQNAAHAIAPNQADFATLKSKGAAALETSVTSNNSRSVLFNYYMNHVKRMLIATYVASSLALAPHLLEIPGYIEAQREWSKYTETLSQAPSRAEATEMKTIELRREREIRRLNQEIENQEKKAQRDEAFINWLKTQLQENIDRSAPAVYMPDPSVPQ